MITLREGSVADVPTVIGIWGSAALARDPHFVPPEDFKRRVIHRLSLSGSVLLIADEATESVGLLMLAQACADYGAGPPIAGIAHISMVAVMPTHWGRGIGRTLMMAALTRARSDGFVQIQLWVHDDNARARRLYDSLSFSDTGESITDHQGNPIRRYVTEILHGVP